MTIRLNGSVWRVHRRKRPENRSLDGNVKYAKRTIYIDPDLTGPALAETIAHEWLHVQWPDLAEEAVGEAAKELARLMTRLGVFG